MFDADLTQRASDLLQRCRERKLTICTVESCTGGLVAALLTSVAGSSDVVDSGFVTYSNRAKVDLVGVAEELLAEHGAVSEEVARAMAEGGLAVTPADLCVAITGIAGPGGGSALKPVGLVHIAVARRGRMTHHRERRFGERGRDEVRALSVREALAMLGHAAI